MVCNYAKKNITKEELYKMEMKEWKMNTLYREKEDSFLDKDIRRFK
jgi:hypothetical protein